MAGISKMVLTSFVKVFIIISEIVVVKSFTIYRSFSVEIPKKLKTIVSDKMTRPSKECLPT